MCQETGETRDLGARWVHTYLTADLTSCVHWHEAARRYPEPALRAGHILRHAPGHPQGPRPPPGREYQGGVPHSGMYGTLDYVQSRAWACTCWDGWLGESAGRTRKGRSGGHGCLCLLRCGKVVDYLPATFRLARIRSIGGTGCSR